MPKLVILGTSNAVPDEQHENTHMVMVGEDRSVLIDCPANPINRLRKVGVGADQVSDLILTHFHPDHVSGVALYMMDAWLMGRKSPLQVHGLDYTIERAEKLMDLYDWRDWPGFFPLSYRRLLEEEMVPVMQGNDFRVFASRVRHIIPTIGLRLESARTGKVIAYSCDTEPCAEVERLASGADVLIHEASGASYGHTSAAQAGVVASRSGARSLYLIHYPTQGVDPNELIRSARENFAGLVDLAKDFLELEF